MTRPYSKCNMFIRCMEEIFDDPNGVERECENE